MVTGSRVDSVRHARAGSLRHPSREGSSLGARGQPGASGWASGVVGDRINVSCYEPGHFDRVVMPSHMAMALVGKHRLDCDRMNLPPGLGVRYGLGLDLGFGLG